VIVIGRQTGAINRSATAAERSASVAERALTTLESPAVVIKIVDPGVYIGSYNSGAYERKTLVYRFANHGRTVAHILGFDQKVCAMRPAHGSPTPLNADDIAEQAIYGMMVAPNGGESEDIRYSVFNEVAAADVELLDDVRNIVFSLFIARYQDIFGAPYVTAFEFIFDARGTGRFVLTNHGEPYNYLRQEKNPHHSEAGDI
jgi:hypothetical protein